METLVRRKQLQVAVQNIQQRYGLQALTQGKPLFPGGEEAIPHIATGFPSLDEALGIGGLARGRLSEIVGPATSGKTTLALQFLASAQAPEGIVGYVDFHRVLDPDYAHRCGIDLQRLAVLSPHDSQEALTMTEAAITNGAFAALVVDAPDDLWDNAAPSLAASIDRWMAPLHKAGTALVFLHAPVGSLTSSHRALAHYASVRLYVACEHWLRHYRNIQGCQARVEILKNRLAAANRQATIQLSFHGTTPGDDRR
ncbi:MAG: recombinase A [Chloroflexi bacterium ADurb.Bin180]|nr:MAG: recombinase A [Chloroflexi bacterium ADurb.Bin180]